MVLKNETFFNCSENSFNDTCNVHGFPKSTTASDPPLKDGARTLFLIGFVLAWLSAILTISLNSVVIIIIHSYKKRSRLYFFLLNLAIADLAGGLLDALPHAIERSLGLDHVVSVWVAGNVFCKIQRTVAQTCLTTSNYILAAMSVDRAYVICKPLLNIRRGSILQKTIVMCCWAFCFLCNSPLLKYYEASYYPDAFSFSTKQQCTFNFGTDILSAYKINLFLKFTFMFLVPLMIIIGAYTMLVVSIYRRSLNQTPDEKKSETTEGSRLSRVFNRGVTKSKLKSIKLTLGIVLSFFVCWMAYFVGYFLAVFAGFSHPTLLILTTFYYWNSIANPIIFFVYHRKKVQTRSMNTRLYTYSSEPHHSGDDCVPTHRTHTTYLPNETDDVAI